MVSFHDLLNETVGLRPSQKTTTAAGISIIQRLGFVEDEVIHIVFPNIRSFFILHGQALGIQNMAKACIVGSQHELHPFKAISNLVFNVLSR